MTMTTALTTQGGTATEMAMAMEMHMVMTGLHCTGCTRSHTNRSDGGAPRLRVRRRLP